MDAIYHRRACGWKHFWARKDQLGRRKVSLAHRLKRLHQTVYRTILWGAGGRTISASMAKNLKAIELRMLRIMLCRKKRIDESWITYLQRTAELIRKQFLAARLPSRLGGALAD